MKTFVLICIAMFVATASSMHCENKPLDIPKEWIDMVDPCIQQMRRQIKEELKASMQYLAMASYFGRDSVNRPGFSKIFYESANEERQHGIKLIEYLLMRGGLTSETSSLIDLTISPKKVLWDNGVAALKDALKLETEVTKSIRTVIKVCENPNENQIYNDYHLVDYLTGVYLEEQYKGQREISGRISTLGKLMNVHGQLGEFLFDKKLLSGEV